MNWQESLGVYAVLIAITVWSLLHHAIPHLQRRVQAALAIVVVLGLGSLGFYGTHKQYRKEHPRDQEVVQNTVDKTATPKAIMRTEPPSASPPPMSKQPPFTNPVTRNVGPSLPHDSVLARPPNYLRGDLVEADQKRFVDGLVVGDSDKYLINIDCPANDEPTCVYAAQYLDLFKRAGWKLSDGVIHRVTLGVPVSGIRLGVYSNVTFDPNQPPGTGHWLQITPGMMAALQAFANVQLGADFTSGSTIPQGTMEVYFGTIESTERAKEDLKTAQMLIAQYRSRPFASKPQQ